MSRKWVLSLAFLSAMMTAPRVQGQSACTASPNPNLAISACTAEIKAIQKLRAHCHDEMIWASSTHEPSPFAFETIPPPEISPECSYYSPAPPLLTRRDALRSGSVVPGRDGPPPPNLGEDFRLRGDAYVKKGKFYEAVDDYTESLKILRNDPAILYRRGQAYHSVRNYSHAIDDFTLALKFSPAQPEMLAARCLDLAITGSLPAPSRTAMPLSLLPRLPRPSPAGASPT
jgi:tetratricopeptide (TPR) repeat protein